MIAINDLPDEYSVRGFFYHQAALENQDESTRLAQPKAAYEFLSTVKELVDESLGEGEYQLPGLVQIFKVFTATGEFFPGGHFKQIIARVLFEDGITRTIRGYEHFLAGNSEIPPGGEAGIDIIPDLVPPQEG